MNSLSFRQKAWLICLIGSVICLGLMAYKSKMKTPDQYDARQYVTGAYNLVHNNVYSESVDPEASKLPGIGREPGYAYILSWVLKANIGEINKIKLDCIYADGGCGLETYSSAQWVNRAFFALAGILLFWSAWYTLGSLTLSTIAGSSVWLNIKMQSSMDQIVSDPFALFLVSLLTFLFILGFKNKNATKTMLYFLLAGLTLSGLILTKAVFLYYLYAVIGAVILYAIFLPHGRRNFKKIMLPLLAFTLFSAIGPSLWTIRNGEVSGQYKLTDTREGIALSARNIFHDMTVAEYFTSFIFWIPGFGDNLAKNHLPESAWTRFDSSNPDGFFLKGHNDYSVNMHRIAEELGISTSEAEKIWTTELKKQILTNPVTHIATTLPLFYRGILRDLFIPFSLPGAIFLFWWAYRNRNGLILLAISPALFNLVFYPLVSLNVSRYQITAAPAFAFGLVFFFIMIGEWRKKKNAQKASLQS